MLGRRIRQLRLAKGYTLDDLIERMGGVVTKQALSKYELDKSIPSKKVLVQIASALSVKAMELWNEPELTVEFIAFRKGSRLPKRSQEQVQAMVVRSLEERVRLQKMTHPENGFDLQLQSQKADNVDDAELAAMNVRDRWSLGLDPIHNVTDLLENHFIHVLEIEADQKFDGLSAVAKDEDDTPIAAAAVTRCVPFGDRIRFNLAHELGHLVLRPDPDDEKFNERTAFRFAGAFLVPKESLKKDVGNRRTNISLDELCILKKRYGLSIQALLYRLKDLNVISPTYYKQWCMDINRTGMRKEEPCPIQPEESPWLSRNTLRALAEGLITKEEARSLVGKDAGDALPFSLLEKKEVLKLSLKERRAILEEQASRIASYYEGDKDRINQQGGDVIEY